MCADTTDIIVLIGALIGLGAAKRYRDPGFAGMAIAAGVGAVLGSVASRFLRTVSSRTRVIFLLVMLLGALPVIGSVTIGE